MTHSEKWGDEVLKRYNKDAAILKILKVLKNAMLVVNKHNRDEALTLAEEHGINTKDLIETWEKIAMGV